MLRLLSNFHLPKCLKHKLILTYLNNFKLLKVLGIWGNIFADVHAAVGQSKSNFCVCVSCQMSLTLALAQTVPCMKQHLLQGEHSLGPCSILADGWCSRWHTRSPTSGTDPACCVLPYFDIQHCFLKKTKWEKSSFHYHSFLVIPQVLHSTVKYL